MDRETGLVRHFSMHERGRTAFMVILLAIAGVMEAFGVATALPLLEKIGSPGVEPERGLAEAVTLVFRWLGIAPSVGALLIALVGLFTLKGVFSLWAMVQVGTVVARVTMELRLRLLRAVANAEWRQVLSYPSGFISNAISRDSRVAAAAYREFCQVVAEGMQVIAYLSLAFLISWGTATLALLVGLGIMALLQGRLRATKEAGDTQTRVLRSIVARLTDALPNLKPLKAMGREQYLLPLLESETKDYFLAQRRGIAQMELINRGREPIVVLAMALGLWAVLTVTNLSSTSIVIMALLFYRTVTTFTNMQHRWGTVLIGESAFQSVMEHIHAAEAARETWSPSKDMRAPEYSKEIRLQELRFRYGAEEVLRGVNASLRAGGFVVLTGPSGSGKTTLTDLIIGLLRPTGGRVLIDGTDLEYLDMRSWRKMIGYVPQEPMLFSDSVFRNVQLGADSVSSHEVEQALRAADAWDFVEALDGGMEHRIGEGGTQLSGGQRQRIAIARALVFKPTLLILDEPTSALDARTESEICETISRQKGHLTILAISHHAAIRRLADEVWELRNGILLGAETLVEA